MLKDLQVEYLVVTYKDDDPQVTLSLRQADILSALAHDEKLEAGCVPDLQQVDRDGYVTWSSLVISNVLQRSSTPNIPSRVWQIYVRGYSWQTMGNRFQRLT